MTSIHLATTDADVLRCFPVMHELRPHLVEADFVARVRRQEAMKGFRLAATLDEGEVRAVAGFYVSECLAWGTYLFVDDLVTAEAARSRGYGQALFAWLLAHARGRGCEQLHLDSGAHRYGAHRFYLSQRMDITSHHFALLLG